MKIHKLLLMLTILTMTVIMFAGCAISKKSETTETSSQETITVDTNSEEATEAETSSEEIQTAGESQGADADSQEYDGEVRTIKVAYSGTSKPIAYLDDNGEAAGYDLEVLKAVFEKLPQYKLEFVATGDFGAIFSGIQSGQYQIAANNFSFSDERAKTYLYTYPYDKLRYVFITKTGEPAINSWEDGVGKIFETTTGVSAATAVESWNEDNPDKQIKVVYVEEGGANIYQDINEGRADFTLTFSWAYNLIQDEYGFDFQENTIEGEDLARIAKDIYAYYLLPQDEVQLRDEINQILVELEADGTLSRLSKEIIGEDCAPEAERFTEENKIN